MPKSLGALTAELRQQFDQFFQFLEVAFSVLVVIAVLVVAVFIIAFFFAIAYFFAVIALAFFLVIFIAGAMSRYSSLRDMKPRAVWAHVKFSQGHRTPSSTE